MVNTSGGVPLPIVGAGQNTCRQRYTFPGVLAALLLAAPVEAQSRVVEHHQFSDPEGRLIAFYSAAMTFSPAGASLIRYVPDSFVKTTRSVPRTDNRTLFR